MKQQLTVKQALELRYQHYLGDGEYIQEIEDIDEDDEFPHGAVLCDTLGIPVVKITSAVIQDLIADWIYRHVGDKCEAESIAERAYKKIMATDFSDTADMINAMFETELIYNSTDIELIP